MDIDDDPAVLGAGADRLDGLAAELADAVDRLSGVLAERAPPPPGSLAARCEDLIAGLRADVGGLVGCAGRLRAHRHGLLAGESAALSALRVLRRRLDEVPEWAR